MPTEIRRSAQIAAASWAAGVLATTALVLVSYLCWWRAEQNRQTPAKRRTP